MAKSNPLQPEYNAYMRNSRSLGALIGPTPYVGTVMPNSAVSSGFGLRTLNGKSDFHPGLDRVQGGDRMTLGRIIAVALLLSGSIPAQAQKPLLDNVPPGKWKWYYGLFNSVGAFGPPGIFWGSATTSINGQVIKIDMTHTDPLDGEKPPSFVGRIDANNQIDGVMDGILTEDPRTMHGHYRKIRWGGCLTETIVLEEKFRNENVLIFRRGTPAGC